MNVTSCVKEPPLTGRLFSSRQVLFCGRRAWCAAVHCAPGRAFLFRERLLIV
jgi:hypothetical protein